LKIELEDRVEGDNKREEKRREENRFGYGGEEDGSYLRIFFC